MRTRLKDVAAKLQLSPALVSGVLNNRPHVWASEETRARILEAAQELNYHPSAAAQALSKGKTNTIALVYRRLEGAAYRLAYSGLVDALSAELQESGYDLVVSNFATQREVMDHLGKLASSRACDAVVLWGREEDTEPQGELMDSLRMPFVVKGRHEMTHPEWTQVDFDHERMIEQSVDHLVDLGHKRLAYLGFPHDEGFVYALRNGFISAYERRFGHAPDPAFMGEFPDEVAPNAERVDEWLRLSRDKRPTGFVIGAGNKAWQAIEAVLASRGERLEERSGGFSGSGITSTPFTLMFGEAKVYQGIEIDNLAEFAKPGLMRVIAQESGTSQIYRFLPALTMAHSLAIPVAATLPASAEGESNALR